MRDAAVMAFSTASSTATMPVTYACLSDKVGLRDESASIGALVGTNFNNDGTALYEAMAALFVSQLIGHAPRRSASRSWSCSRRSSPPSAPPASPRPAW